MSENYKLVEPINLDNIKENVRLVNNMYNSAQDEFIIYQRVNNDLYMKCIEYSGKLIVFLDTLNPFEINRIKSEIVTIYYISGETLARTVGLHLNRHGFTDQEKNVLYTSINHLQKVLYSDPFNEKGKELYKIIFIFLTIFNTNCEENIKLLKNVLNVDPGDYQLQYNIAFMYQRINDLENSLIHFKLALSIINLQMQVKKFEKVGDKDNTNKDIDAHLVALTQYKVKCLNGIGSIYFSIQDRELANYFFYKALEVSPDDPDINNQIGVVFTELRLTDQAIKHYSHGIKHFKNAHISNDLDMLLASMHMNMGLAYCYEINYPKAIECYNKALVYKPRLSLAYQNKLLDMNYISHLIEDPMYIANLHKNINLIYPEVINNYKVSLPNYKINKDILSLPIRSKYTTKLRIGFISGDYICHPVSYFLSSILKNINYNIFDVYCYSLKVVDIKTVYPQCKIKIVKGTSPQELKDIIQKDNIDILFDLASQTGDNRLDTFVLKPAPIQISYIGYPNTSGLSNMDYHIVDNYTDSDGMRPGPGGIIRSSTQKYYTEKLLFMPNCFLNYTPSIGFENLPDLSNIQPCIKNEYLTIGTFNRYNKINDTVVALWERILIRCPNVKFIIKTKEFLTDKLKNQFINTWKNQEILKRVQIVQYSDLYTQHLKDYNKMDIAVDTFPYSGTTTSAEALCMGVPVLTLFDSEKQYHCQNVTSSFMANSDLPEFIVFNEEEFIDKIEYYSNNLINLRNLKKVVRDNFLNGHVCNHIEFINDFEDLILNTYKNHTW